jgi:cytochrome c-type biogenesis protein CcmH
MVSFWVLAGALCVLAAGFILWPLRRTQSQVTDRENLNVRLYDARLAEIQTSRDEGQLSDSEFEALEKELQLGLLADAGRDDDVTDSETRLPFVAAALLIGLCVFLYGDFGLSLGALDDLALSTELRETSEHDMAGVRGTVEKLEVRLATQPDNDQGWFLLAQSWRSLQEYGRAALAFKHLADRYPGDSAMAGYYAETLYLAEGQQFSESVLAAINRTLALDGSHAGMLELSAMASYHNGDVMQALSLFRQVLATGVEGERAALVQQAIDRLSAEAGIDESAVAAAGSETSASPGNAATQPASPGRQLQVLVELASGVDVAEEDTVYVYARAMSGPPMPLAVQRLTVANLPSLVTLTTAQAMMQGMSLDDFDQVQLVARISASGIANASPDDYEVLSAGIDMTKDNPVVKMTIANRRGG